MTRLVFAHANSLRRGRRFCDQNDSRMFLLIGANCPTGLCAIEVSLFGVAAAINAIATYEFFWTSMLSV